MRKLALVLVSSFLAACGQGSTDQDVKARRSERLKSAQAEAAKPLAPRAQQVGNNELLTIDVTSADRFGYLERQRCYVWRDRELQAASISCPNSPEIVVNE